MIDWILFYLQQPTTIENAQPGPMIRWMNPLLFTMICATAVSLFVWIVQEKRWTLIVFLVVATLLVICLIIMPPGVNGASIPRR